MAHRGRLNILTNVMGKTAQAIFHEFAGGATNPADVGGSGDVKYHLGTSSDREFDGNKVHLSLLPNPSHLEAVDPVVLGKARAIQTFGRDIVIDMWCYRRFGHNEGDEPSFTQPLMYAAIKKHPPISQIYGGRLIKEGVVDQAWIDQQTNDYLAQLEREFQSATSYLPNKADWFEGRWAGLGRPDEPVLGRRNIPTAIDEAEVRRLGEVLTTVPDGFQIHKTLQRILDAKKEMFGTGAGFDWSTAEALAFGSLLAEGQGVRLSGQDSGRGTFSQRHAVWVDQLTAAKYIPLCSVDGGRFEVRDSPLSEFGVLGFEYGYSLADPKTLVLWEAQFGDFANGAQSIIDQFVAAGEAKWLRASGLVMLLPHGFEGQGPEHSSARLERYLQL